MLKREVKKQTILLTGIGNRDPYTENKTNGPILSLLSERQFDKIFILSTPGTTDNAEMTINTIKTEFPNIEAENCKTEIEDPYDYVFIIKQLRIHAVEKIYRNNLEAQFYIFIGPGLPQMQTCWFLLAASGEISANLLFVREKRFLKPNESPVGEIDPRSKELPHIEQKNINLREIKGVSEDEIKEAIKKCGIVTENQYLKEELIKCAKAAVTDDHILVLGETGTGKELIARFIHYLSRRKNHTFIPFNSGRFDEGILMAELFGYKKGAFTGAEEGYDGLIRGAHNGTLFLDEVGDLPQKAQAGILRAIDNGEITPLGSKEPIKINVRFIAATNKDIENIEIFRNDLFYRFQKHIIKLQPLRERKDDIPILALHFLRKANESYCKNVEFDQRLLSHLQEYEWLGNVRELKSIIERVVIYTECEKVDIDEFKKIYRIRNKIEKDVFYPPELNEGFSMEDYIEKIKTEIVERALKQTNGNQSAAARLLGITPQAVNKHVKKIR